MERLMQRQHEFAKKPGGEPDEFLGGIFILDLKDKKASDKVKRWAEIEGRDKNERMLGLRFVHGTLDLDIERWNG
ncbi:uncharacterized protein KY384_005054 [Bacidia gigantensis]|uniref:uncharacterized protein n=1 Tax=Bacidia gigantensis TaxID=2732470 RepID=UPI001D0555E9|nr:uncharacterized protein KY384_005054 [Bacidia gigantensis]KAG8530551.1 hypothetical protein KY384_005054 [Bacidia gigantensis]